MAWFRHWLTVVLVTMAASCAEHDSDKELRYHDLLGRGYEGSDVKRLVNLEQSPSDQSCLVNGRTWIRGNVTDHEIDELLATARSKWPDEPINYVEVSPQVAIVSTGIDCHGQGSGIGHTLFFEPNGVGAQRRWQSTLESSWIG